MDYKETLRKLTLIGYSLSSEKDLDALMHLILKGAREMLSCDSGTIYIRKTLESGSEALEFSDVQNDSMEVQLARITIPIAPFTIPGYAATRGETVVIADAYSLSGQEPYQFSREFDNKTGYRTMSIMAIPMRDRFGHVLGIISLYNKKRTAGLKLASREEFIEQVIPFTDEDRMLAESIASQAAMALENARLYQEITMLFEGFVSASVAAVEYRDPATAGHSERVAKLTVELARKINETAEGVYRDVEFSKKDMVEMFYAALLHDFGKIGVRENVLLKQNKLYWFEMELLKARYKFIKEQTRREALERKLEYLLENGRDAYFEALGGFDSGLSAKLDEIEDALQFIMRINNPQILRTDIEGVERLGELANRHYTDEDGESRPWLEQSEYKNLSIMKGSLNDEEWNEIQSHVTHSFNFLSKIPWTKDLANVADIAYTHHERLNGRGYPRGLKAHEIPLQGKMMLIADIFDALTAADRPYKKSISVDRAISILEMEKKDGALDPELLRIFAEGKVYEALMPKAEGAVV